MSLRWDRVALGVLVGSGWLLAVFLVDAAVPDTVVPDVLYAVAPLIACALLGPAGTAAFGVAAVTLVALAGYWRGGWGAGQEWVRLVDAVLVSAAGVVVAAVHGRRERQMVRLTAISDTVQRAILPTLPVRATGVRATARYVSAAHDTVVGGDLYDGCLAGGRVRFIVGDVRGKGIVAVEQAARVIRAFRQAAPMEESLAGVASNMDAYMGTFLGEEEFVTALLVDLTCPGEIRVTSCGHPPALLVRAAGGCQVLEVPAGLPLGLGGTYASTPFSWGAGDRLLMYTDGLSEARGIAGDFLELDELAPLVGTGTLDQALDAVLARVRDHVAHHKLGDDLAAVLLEAAPEFAAADAGSRPRSMDPPAPRP